MDDRVERIFCWISLVVVIPNLIADSKPQSNPGGSSSGLLAVQRLYRVIFISLVRDYEMGDNN